MSPRSSIGATRSVRARLLADNLPRHDVRVVLQPGQQHFVARLQHHPAVGLRDEVDAVGRAGRQDDRSGIGSVDEARRLRARPFVRRRRPLAQQVRRAVDVRVGVAIVVVHRLQDGRRLLARVGAVEIHERLAVHDFPQDREVGSDRADIEGWAAGRAEARPSIPDRNGGLGFSRAALFKLCDRQGLYPIA